MISISHYFVSPDIDFFKSRENNLSTWVPEFGVSGGVCLHRAVKKHEVSYCRLLSLVKS